MYNRGPSVRLAEKDSHDRTFNAGDAVTEAKVARWLAQQALARAEEALARAEEAVWRAVYRQSAEATAREALQRGLGGLGRQHPLACE